MPYRSFDRSSAARTALCVLAGTLLAAPALAGPAVVPTAEGQIGSTPNFFDQVFGVGFQPLQGGPGSILLAEINQFNGPPAPSSGFDFFSEQLHQSPNPVVIGDFINPFMSTDRLPPRLATPPGATPSDAVIGIWTTDGAMPQTLTVVMGRFDVPNEIMTTSIVASGLLAPVPDPFLSATGLAVDNQRQVTVIYNDLGVAGPIGIKGRRFDADGNPIGNEFVVSLPGRAGSDIALLDPSGNRMVVVGTKIDEITGQVIDFTGPSPNVLPEFPVSTTPAGVANLFPSLASDPTSGKSVVAWENLTDLPGDPVNVYARRFDADGNPIGNDFRVNATTANAQGQPKVAVGPNGIFVVVWAGDAAVLPANGLDVFAQAYDAEGNPIGGEMTVNTFQADFQDRPAVRFMPDPDAQGRPQFAVVWRDVGEADGSEPRGTGTSYRCFSIDGLEDPTEIFADGFESGDTTSWSDTQP